MTTEIFEFPTIPVSKQVFYVPGQAIEGGYTAGAVRIITPSIGGRGILELQVSLQTKEWDHPISSWLMSKGNGEVFRVKLAPTPQILGARSASSALWAPEPGVPWTGDMPWAGEITTVYTSAALEGTTTVTVNMAGYGDIARVGHVIGHKNNCHVIDKVVYNSDTDEVTFTVKPPLRNDVQVGDLAPFRPYFLGTIGNIDEVYTTYDADNNGAIQIGKIKLFEAIVS